MNKPNMDAMGYEPLAEVIKTQIYLFVENHVPKQVRDQVFNQVWNPVITQTDIQVCDLILDQMKNE